MAQSLDQVCALLDEALQVGEGASPDIVQILARVHAAREALRALQEERVLQWDPRPSQVDVVSVGVPAGGEELI